MAAFSIEEIGKNIATQRKKLNYTQQELAEKIGVTESYISKLERGQKTLKVKTLCAIAEALRVSCDEVLFGTSSNAHLETIKQLLADKPPDYLVGIEDLIRVCDANFESKAKDSSHSKDTQ